MGFAVLTAITLVTAALVGLSDAWVVGRSADRVFEPAEAPAVPVAIVLGAGVADGQPGAYVRSRLETAVRLFEDGTIKTIIVSGAETRHDDEVTVMRNYLQHRGVPADRLISDADGFNTAASCRNAATVYRLKRVLLVTQDFHVGRAVALCRGWGIDAFGVIAGCDCSTRMMIHNNLREILLARPKAFLMSRF
jgi:vancomycin permeability regulator SanA